MAPGPLVDTDAREGHFRVIVRFGPNMLDGSVTEANLTGYSVFGYQTGAGRLPGGALATVPVSSASASRPASCCQDDAYSAEILGQFPANSSRLRLEIVPITVSGGALYAGLLTDVVADRANPPVSRARRGATAAALTLVLAVATAAAVAAADASGAR